MIALQAEKYSFQAAPEIGFSILTRLIKQEKYRKK
jgi:hypothetical protein